MYPGKNVFGREGINIPVERSFCLRRRRKINNIDVQKRGTSIVLHKKAKKLRSSPAQKHVNTEAPAPQSPASSLDGHQHQRQHQRQHHRQCQRKCQSQNQSLRQRRAIVVDTETPAPQSPASSLDGRQGISASASASIIASASASARARIRACASDAPSSSAPSPTPAQCDLQHLRWHILL
jgi:hypothetical protein